MATSRQLYALQEIDLKLDEEEGALAQVERALEDDRELSQARAAIDLLRESLARLEKDQRWQEGQLEGLKSKLSPSEKKLYSGEVTNPKELLGLQQDVEMLKRHYRQEEEKLLELWEGTEAAQRDLNQQSRHLEEIEARWRQVQHDLNQRREELIGRISQLRQKREGLSQHLDPSYLKVYEDIRKIRHTAVARIEQGRCRGCQLALSLSELQRARSGLIQCSSCQRILLAE